MKNEKTLRGMLEERKPKTVCLVKGEVVLEDFSEIEKLCRESECREVSHPDQADLVIYAAGCPCCLGELLDGCGGGTEDTELARIRALGHYYPQKTLVAFPYNSEVIEDAIKNTGCALKPSSRGYRNHILEHYSVSYAMGKRKPMEGKSLKIFPGAEITPYKFDDSFEARMTRTRESIRSFDSFCRRYSPGLSKESVKQKADEAKKTAAEESKGAMYGLALIAMTAGEFAAGAYHGSTGTSIVGDYAAIKMALAGSVGIGIIESITSIDSESHCLSTGIAGGLFALAAYGAGYLGGWIFR